MEYIVCSRKSFVILYSIYSNCKITSRSAGGSFEKQCGTSFYHKDWNIDNKNIVSRKFIVKTSLDQLDKIVKIKNTTQLCHIVKGVLIM